MLLRLITLKYYYLYTDAAIYDIIYKTNVIYQEDEMVTKKEEELFGIFAKLGIEYKRYEHEPVYTVEEANKISGNIPGVHVKNLFVCSRKDLNYYLIILPDEKKANLKKISKEIDDRGLHLAKEEALEKYLNIKPGNVGPFSLIYDKDKAVTVLIDRSLKGECPDGLGFHPNTNTATIVVSESNFNKFLKWCKNRVEYIDI